MAGRVKIVHLVFQKSLYCSGDFCEWIRCLFPFVGRFGDDLSSYIASLGGEWEPPRDEGTLCSTFVHSSPADWTCSLRHLQMV